MTTPADWAESARRLLDVLRPPTGAPDGSGEAPPVHGTDCRWCPVCQTAAVVRGERPEITAALADLLATTASVLRDLAGDPGGPATATDTPTRRDDGDDDGGPAAVQRIDIA